MLYVLRHYLLPVLLAFALHASLGLFLWRGISDSVVEERVIKPKVINSTLLVLEPTESRKRASAPPPAPETAAKPDKVDPRLLENQRQQREETRRKQLALERDKKRIQEEKRKEQEKLAREETARVRAAAELERAARIEAATERAKAERQARLDALATSSLDNATDDDAAQGEEAALAQSFFQGIRSKIVANWSRPASARNGMKVTLRVELVPGGGVAAVSLVTSSGDTAFDRSAETAVRRSERFDVPDDPAIFERRFRRFNLLFNPEDLLR